VNLPSEIIIYASNGIELRPKSAEEEAIKKMQQEMEEILQLQQSRIFLGLSLIWAWYSAYSTAVH